MSGRAFVVLSVILLAVSGVVRLPRLAERSLWLDEARTANHARQSFADTVVKTRLGGSAPVAYPLLLNLVQRLDDSVVAVRLPSLLASVGAVAVLLALPVAGVGRDAAVVAAAILAVSPAQVRYAQEVREYALAVLVAAVLVVAAAACAAGVRRARFAVVSLLAVAPLVQYGLALLASAVLPVTVAVAWRREGARAALRLAILSLAAVVGAAVLRLYPLGPVRQDLFLAPGVAAAVGAGWATLGARLPDRRRALATVALTVGVLAAGGLGIVRADPYREVEDIRTVISARAARRGNEPVYVYYGAWPALRFYRVDGPGFLYGGSHREDPGGYAREFRSLIGGGDDTVWLVFSHVFSGEDSRLLTDLGDEWCFETVVEATGARLVHGVRCGADRRGGAASEGPEGGPNP